MSPPAPLPSPTPLTGGAANLLQALDYSILQQCIHCGLCLPSCPTYNATPHERHSPRGRIALMRAVADGELAVSRAFGEEMSYCLGCLACTSACPAGVNYTELFETARAEVERSGVMDRPRRNLLRWFTLRVLFTRPRTLRLVGRLLWLWQASGAQSLLRRSGLTTLLPTYLAYLEAQTPPVRTRFSRQLIAPRESPPPAQTEANASTPYASDLVPLAAAAAPGPAARSVAMPPASVAETRPRRHVLLLTGCMQDLLFSEVNRATVDVLLANGCTVHTPPVQPCCGSLHNHNGDPATARLLARRWLDLVSPADYDAIISNAGGCGSHLRGYGHLLHDEPAYAERAAEWSRKLRDIQEYLVEIGFRHPAPPPAWSLASSPAHASSQYAVSKPVHLSVTAHAAAPPAPTVVTYHESCHLCHGQKVSRQPREVLRALPGVELRECTEATWCCGSAGVYSLTQPATATWLRERKVDHLLATGAQVVALGNPGCHLHIAGGLAARGETAAALTVVHPVTLLARAYAAETSVRAAAPDKEMS